jgi:predicted kinase
VPQRQAIYHGLVKPRELKHDAALYRLYQKEANRIVQAGGRPLRVVLDYELKRNMQRELAGLGEAAQTRDAREQVAARHGLALVGDRIQIPDLRLEYETADHEHRETNLELATRNYRPQALAQKAKAGFSIYAPSEDASKLRRILDVSELTARIFSL